MSKAAADELAHLHALWLERFGEPPPIIAEPEIMRRVMARVLDRAGAEVFRPVEFERADKASPAWTAASATGLRGAPDDRH